MRYYFESEVNLLLTVLHQSNLNYFIRFSLDFLSPVEIYSKLSKSFY